MPIPLYNEVKPGQIFPPSKTITNFTVALVNDLIEKLNETTAGAFVTPMQFGATGDGVADDWDAVRRALNYCAAHDVSLFLAGFTYNCNSAVLQPLCSIIGPGTIMGRLETSFTPDLIFKDFTLISNNTTYGIYVHGFPLDHMENLTIDNVTIRWDEDIPIEGERLAITPTYVDHLVIRNCDIIGCIQMVECRDFMFLGNTIDGEYGNDDELLHCSINSDGIISGNTFLRSLPNFLDTFTAGETMVITGNRFLGCIGRAGAAIECKVSFSGGGNSSDVNGWTRKNVFSDNYIGGMVSSPISAFQSFLTIYQIDSRPGPPPFDWSETPGNWIVSNNVFEGYDGTGGTGVFCGLLLIRMNAIVVEGNVFRNLHLDAAQLDTSSCIWVEHCRDVNIHGNRINFKNATGVSLHNECHNISISNNHMLEDVINNDVLKYGIRIAKVGSIPDPVVTNSKFDNNLIAASTASFYAPYYASGAFVDNTINGNTFFNDFLLAKVSRCSIQGNLFEVGASTNYACAIGSTDSISSFVTFLGNTAKAAVATAKPCFWFTRVRGSTISNNTAWEASSGILIQGTNSAGELDYLNIKDNFSVNQTSGSFPTKSNVDAGDEATWQSANNQMIT